MRLEYFQLIDRIVEVDIAQRRIRVAAEVPTSSTVFEGHFPGHPLMPGVLLIEAMAQTAGWLSIALNEFARMPFLAAVKDAKLRRFVGPGEKLALAAGIVHEGSGFTVANASARVDGKPVCEATLTFRLTPFPNEDFRAEMRRAAQRLDYPLELPADA